MGLRAAARIEERHRDKAQKQWAEEPGFVLIVIPSKIVGLSGNRVRNSICNTNFPLH